MKATLKSLLFLLLSLFQFHGVVSQSCNTFLYDDGEFYSVELDRCRCFCIPRNSIQLADIVLVLTLNGKKGMCDYAPGEEDPCTWWSDPNVDDTNTTDTNTTDTNTTDTNSTETDTTETDTTRM